MIVTRRTIVVRNLQIMLSIGVHAHERASPQRLSVTVEAVLDVEPHDDVVATTVDYDAICDFTRSLENEPHIELQETVAERILAFTLALPGVSQATVETRKPDIFDDCDFVGVTISGRRA